MDLKKLKQHLDDPKVESVVISVDSAGGSSESKAKILNFSCIPVRSQMGAAGIQKMARAFSVFGKTSADTVKKFNLVNNNRRWLPITPPIKLVKSRHEDLRSNRKKIIKELVAKLK